MSTTVATSLFLFLSPPLPLSTSFYDSAAGSAASSFLFRAEQNKTVVALAVALVVAQ